MNAILALILSRRRTVLSTLVLLFIVGINAYLDMPKEATPDIPIPIIYVSMRHEGISPEDAERLLIRPMEQELRSIEGLKELRSNATEGFASVVLEFEAGFDNEKALDDVRDAVDIAKAELPRETDEPIVNEVNFSLFPVLVVSLSGNVPERALIRMGRDLREKIEGIPEVLEAKVVGDREEEVQILIDPAKLEHYGLSQRDVIGFVSTNNKLVPAGTIDSGSGRMALKIPGLLQTAKDIMRLPLKSVNGRVITVQDIAVLVRTFKDPQSIAHEKGLPAVALQIKKRSGENVIATIEKVKALVNEEAKNFPENISIGFLNDQSDNIRDQLLDLQNNIISAVLLVMIIILLSLGARSATLIGLSIPGSFFMGIWVLSLMGVTINNVVLFGLIMAVGMLVDGTIVVTELADRKMMEGLLPTEAYLLASQRMAWPIISSTATTLAAFMPLLFWPGIVGQFMRYLPITLIATLSASLLMALVFIPALGGRFGRPGSGDAKQLKALSASESGDLSELTGITGWYIRRLTLIVEHPVKVLLAAIGLFFGVYLLYFKFGQGVEFFPDIEPDQASILVRMRGDLSIYEMDDVVLKVAQRMESIPGIKSRYSTTEANRQGGGNDVGEDAKGVIQIEFTDWKTRPKAEAILEQISEATADIPGVIIETRQDKPGPPTGKPVQLLLSSREPSLLPDALKTLLAKIKSMPELIDVEDSSPLEGIEWAIEVDREEASRFGASVETVGNLVQLASYGLKLGEYRPHDADDEVDIRIRYLPHWRHLGQIERMRVDTPHGLVPIVNFAKKVPRPKVSQIQRYNERRYFEVKAEVIPEVLPERPIKAIKEWMEKEKPFAEGVEVLFKGEDEDQREAQAFLGEAFFVALFVMAIILVTQFNRFYQAFLVLSAVVFSTVGVFLGLLLIGEPFGIVMNGIGVIALAGIVVNNNIVLIDTFDHLYERGQSAVDAVLRTCAQRFRPVMLTTITTILGLAPMVLKIEIDFVNRSVSRGSPSTQWWYQLSTSIAFGLAFATLLTLILTPSLLVLGEKIFAYFQDRRAAT